MNYIYTEYEEQMNRETPNAKKITAILSKKIACKHCKDPNIEFVHRTDPQTGYRDALYFRCRFCGTPRKFYI